MHGLSALDQIDEHGREYGNVHRTADQKGVAERKLSVSWIKEKEAGILQDWCPMDIRIDLGHPAGHEIAVFLADIKRKEDSDGADILVFAKQDPQPEMMLILRAQRQFEYMSVFFFRPCAWQLPL